VEKSRVLERQCDSTISIGEVISFDALYDVNEVVKMVFEVPQQSYSYATIRGRVLSRLKKAKDNIRRISNYDHQECEVYLKTPIFSDAPEKLSELNHQIKKKLYLLRFPHHYLHLQHHYHLKELPLDQL
jgi:hypothetical protein